METLRTLRPALYIDRLQLMFKSAISERVYYSMKYKQQKIGNSFIKNVLINSGQSIYFFKVSAFFISWFNCCRIHCCIIFSNWCKYYSSFCSNRGATKFINKKRKILYNIFNKVALVVTEKNKIIKKFLRLYFTNMLHMNKGQTG